MLHILIRLIRTQISDTSLQQILINEFYNKLNFKDTVKFLTDQLL